MKKISITLGNFDGVHRGHQALISTARGLADEVYALTFRPHPAEILVPERAPVRILDYRDQERFLRHYGAKNVKALSFTEATAQLGAREFFSREILSLRPFAVVVGHDFRFGHSREAGVIELGQYCQENGIQFCDLKPVLEGEKVISSTWIRDCLRQGDFKMAQHLMGHPFEFSGLVIEGKKLGRTLGFPTANLQLAAERKGKLPLTFGVYAGVVRGEGPFVMNVGQNPTTSQNTTVAQSLSLKVEIHLLGGGAKDLYGKTLEVEPQFFLRPEKKFSSLEELKKQIQNDVIEARSRLGI